MERLVLEKDLRRAIHEREFVLQFQPQYDLKTGRSESKEWACIPIYEVRVEGDEVYVALPGPPAAKAQPLGQRDD